MEIILYNNLSETNKITKRLENPEQLFGTLKEGSNILNPSILIERNEVITKNYVSIPDFGKYYFIQNISNVKNNIWRLDLKVDVLQTYKDSILNNNALIERQEKDYNPYLVDSLLPIISDSDIITKKLTNALDFKHFSYIIMMNSGTSK